MIQFVDGEPIHIGDNDDARPTSSLRDLLKDIARNHGVTIEALRGPRRDRPYPQIRGEFIRRARDMGRYSTTQIGLAINRDHTTVLHWLGTRKRLPHGPERPRIFSAPIAAE